MTNLVARLLAGLLLATAVAGPLAAQTSRDPTRVLDDFEALSGWSAQPSEGVTLRIAQDTGVSGQAMRLDFDFHGHGGYAIARKAFDIPLPANYAFSFKIRGRAPTENLEFKLVDSTGANVWWTNARNFEFPARWTTVSRPRRHIEFAWGPVGGGPMARVAAIEIVITAGSGGKGTVWIDDFTFAALPPANPFTGTPTVTASSAAPRQQAGRAVDGDSATSWRSATGGMQSLTLDLGAVHELGGVAIAWTPGLRASDYTVELSNDGERWRTAEQISGAAGARDFVSLPETETRFLRLALAAGASAYGIREIAIQPVAATESANAFWRSVARASARGTFPKYLSDSAQSYWTIVGVNGDTHEGLLNEEGMLETDAGSFSIEPFLRVGDTLVTWADVTPTQRLEKGSLPIPSVQWKRGDLSLTVTASADGAPGSSSLLARYRLANAGKDRIRTELVLAIRPLQVNPPWQFLNLEGGASSIRSLRWANGAMRVNDDRLVVPLSTPTTVGTAPFIAGGVVIAMREGRFPRATSAEDSSGRAEGALAYTVNIAPGGSRDIYVEIPFANRAPARGDGAERLAASIQGWSQTLLGVSITLPQSAQRVAESIHSTLGYILVNRDGAAIQPGSRSYQRSWIRDGALTSAAMLRLGREREVKEFLEWFAPFQFPSGKVPCCVDSRGADPVPENDSHGELIMLVAEYYRYTNDRATVEKMWPHVERAVAYMDSLRHEPGAPAEPVSDSTVVRGLLPASISHEGYSAKAMHSYWDDFFALRGLEDAAELATVLGRAEEATRYAGMRDEFRRDLHASIALAMKIHHIDFIPGSAELGDFDATSTTVAIAPGDELGRLPAPAVQNTFQRYYEHFIARRDGLVPDSSYTPYEWRVAGTMVRLGWRAGASQLLDFFMSDQRPAAWHEWAEVVWKDPRTPRFIGDMPHTWVGSDFIRSVLDMFAYERAQDSTLVIGAGVPDAWVREKPGTHVRGLRTTYGALDLDMVLQGDSTVVTIGKLTRMPRGGIVVNAPRADSVHGVTVNASAAAVGSAGEIAVRELPARVVIW